MEKASEQVVGMMRSINRAWLDKRPEDLAPLFHADITFVFPGCSGRLQGRQAVVASFVDFCRDATVHEYREGDYQVDLIGHTAVVSYVYQMVYERSGQRDRATGRDMWLFAREDAGWLAIWRTMLDTAEQPA